LSSDDSWKKAADFVKCVFDVLLGVVFSDEILEFFDDKFTENACWGSAFREF
jgi:hypothetical protein